MKKTILIIVFGVVLVYKPITIENEPPKNKNTAILEAELKCMDLNLYHEARGESKVGILAVGHVTINRTRSKKFPNTICKVVYQKHQFSWVLKQKYKRPAVIPKFIRNISYKLLTTDEYEDPTDGSLYFHNNTVDSFDREKTVIINRHIFYR